MTVGILTEKPSAMRNFAKALGGNSGVFNGEEYVLCAARGHLLELAQPHTMVPKDLEDQYKVWDQKYLPWDHRNFKWKRVRVKGVNDTLKNINNTLRDCDEIVIATDVDPSGEGGLIAVEIIDELGLASKKISRMYFSDEAPKSIQKAFTDRKLIPSLQDFDEYRMADFRSKFDMLTMQFTRVATGIAGGQMLRQGRLKSAMVVIVGDGLKAYNNYKRVPFFENRFRDENGVMYTNPDETRYDKEDLVPNIYSSSPVKLDNRSNKRTAPPKLIDLATLSSRFSPKGIKAKDVLATYQRLYEAQIVSYPRTDDKYITAEQFNELLPLADKIAGVVGVDVSHLTYKKPRGTHVKEGMAHGANRPGINVPTSLNSLKAKYGSIAPLIYEILAKSYLAMLAEDYVYEQQKGHVEKYPDFVGIANVPKSMGWKIVFDADVDVDPDESTSGLGSTADPFVYEGAPVRPPHPSMKWLMKQLEKRDVGTGATRTSTYAEVTNANSKSALLIDTRGKITMTNLGDMSYGLLPGTHIGDLAITEKIMQDMRDIAAGKQDADEALSIVASWVKDDMVTMNANAPDMAKALNIDLKPAGSSEVVEGVWNGKNVKFKRTWSGHRFSDEEVSALLAGDSITFNVTGKYGNYDVKGKLARQTYKGRKYVGFLKEDKPQTVPDVWAKHVFTDDEKRALENGEEVKLTDCVSTKGNNFSATVTYGVEPGSNSSKKKIIPQFDKSSSRSGNGSYFPKTFLGHTFTEDERKEFEDGKTLTLAGLVGKSGKVFTAELTWIDDPDKPGRKKFNMTFPNNRN